MKQSELMNILDDVATGKVTKEEALLAIKEEPFKDMGFAKIDTHRGIRQGVPEVIYGAGKTKEQIKEIVKYLQKSGEETVLITRMSSEAAKFVSEEIDLRYDEISKVGIVGSMPKKDGIGTIVVATAGTSDMYVAEEAALTAEVFGNQVTRLYDVGVAGLHRLISHVDEIMSASVIIAIAGMEGALASVIGAVPTSVGYGANFGGLSALLSMLNSCASGVSVVNIDNGFGAAYQASMINHMRAK